ncbi:Muscarinic acetylcholine receptor M5 [Cichlidogyrus casuarinus]|uniref:Muscarinic acetylcholine receptor M5 n=1 Tax=Cichlidogyrus casuarinus TaxID=1844966 RepID=A0ABD2Q259_9PLAT
MRRLLSKSCEAKQIKRFLFTTDGTETVQTELGGLQLNQATILTLGVVSSAATVIGNVLVILSFPVERQLRSVISNYFLLSLALADLVVGVYSIPLFTHQLYHHGNWKLGILTCDLWLTVDYGASNTSVAHLLVISVDRYLSVTYPLSYRTKRTRKKAIMSCIFSWIISFLIWTPFIFYWHTVYGRGESMKCTIKFLDENRWMVMFTSFFAFYMPATVMIFLYAAIYRATQKRNSQLAELQGNGHSKTKQEGRPSSCFSKRAKKPVNLKYTQVSRFQQRQQLTGARLQNYSLTGSELPISDSSSPIMEVKRLSSEGENSGNFKGPQRSFISNKSFKTSKREQRNEQKAARTLSAILFAFLITWTPYHLTLMLKTGVSKGTEDIVYWLCYLNSTINPLLYALCNETFRMTFWRIMTCRCRVSRPAPYSGAIVTRHAHALKVRSNGATNSIAMRKSNSDGHNSITSNF